MKVQNFPDIDLPTVTVTASLPGASPSQLETDVARKIENQIATLQGVKHIYTSVQDGVATTTVEFRLEKPTQEAVDDVRDAVSRVRSDLPADLRDPIITKFDLAGSPILTYTVASSRMDDEALSWFVDDTVTRALLAVRGVGAVTASAARRARSGSSSTRRACSRSTPPPPTSRGSCARRSARASGGRTDVGGAEQSVRTIATVQSAAELAQMEIALLGRPAHPARPGRARQRHRRRAALGRVPERQAGGRLRDRAHARRRRGRRRARRARRRSTTLKTPHPDIAITEAFNFVDPVEENYEGSMALLYEGAALAVLVVWLFLRDWRATLVAVDGAAAVGHPGVLRHVPARLLAQRRDAARAVAGGRHPGRRRDRRDREHRAPPAHGQDARTRRRWKRPTRSAWR